MITRTTLALVTVVVLAAITSETTGAYALLPSKWPNGSVTMHLQLGGGSGTLIDGSTSWDSAFAQATNSWNTHIDLLKFAVVPASSVPKGDGDLLNQVFFADNIYGEDFDDDTLAITTRWEFGGTVRAEADIVFNQAFLWNAYRGNVRAANGREQWDIVRVAMHELGHVLGLDHPDENGQRVTALMNSIINNIDALQPDDITGARSLYGATTSVGVTSNIVFPPRNEPNDFFAQLIALYRDRLGARPVATFVDPEGAVVWLSEYARYRVGLCDHGTAQSRVFNIVDGGATVGVCALTPLGAIPFPPRNEGLQFMNALNFKYRDSLGRSAMTSFVDNEGAVVWVLEYFRYRLNGCTHGDAVTRVFQQILGQGIQPTCRS